MAQRGEGQGLQIAVISFAMLTIILAITTYVFYAQATTAQKDLQSKNKTLQDKQAENSKLLYRVKAMQFVLGLKGTAKEDVDQAKTQAGGDDPEVKEILENFDADSALVGEQVVPAGPKSYRTINAVLLAALNKKNSSVSDAIDQSRKAQQDRTAAEQAASARAETATASAKKAADDYGAEAEKFASDRAKNEEEKVALNNQIATTASKSKTDLQKVIDEKDLFVKQNTQLLTTNRMLQGRIDEFKAGQADLFESPDGHISRVNQRGRMVWIDVGRADGLLRQTTFSVYDHDENGVSTATPKARIEVIALGDRLSEARILEDTPANPIIAGDVIHTPAWSPGQRVHFALALKMDINKDRIDDYEMIKSIIKMNGGVIDAELKPDGSREGNISVNTRYFVQGEAISEVTSEEIRKQYNAFETDRQSFNVQKIPVEKLLSLMGWKAEERVFELAGSRGGGDFRKRLPAKTLPAAGAPASESAAPAAESPAAPAAPAGIDPFAAPGAPVPAAPVPASDPFATSPPAGKAAPAAENDPFK
jgi:hypothetical protein